MKTTRLRDLIMEPGPFASVYVDTSQQTETGAHERDLRWRAALDQLRDLGAPDESIKAVDAVARDSAPAVGTAARAVIASGGDIVLDEELTDPPPAPIVRFSRLPFLLALVELGGPGVPYLLVVVDQIGANLRAVDGRGAVVDAGSLDLRDHPVHKVRGGGWAHLRMQHHVEETVKRNLDEVAEQVARVTRRTGAQLVVIAGEVQSRRALHEALPTPAAQHAVEVEVGGRAEGTDDEALEQAVHEMVHLARADADNAVRTRFAAELERNGLASEGVARACEALTQANVDTLIVDPGTLGDRTVFVSGNPMLVSTQAADLEQLGESDVSEERADEALPRAAVAVGADIVLAGERLAPNQGVGVLLRHD